MNLWAVAAVINQVDFFSNNLHQGMRVLISSQTHTHLSTVFEVGWQMHYFSF